MLEKSDAIGFVYTQQDIQTKHIIIKNKQDMFKIMPLHSVRINKENIQVSEISGKCTDKLKSLLQKVFNECCQNINFFKRFAKVGVLNTLRNIKNLDRCNRIDSIRKYKGTAILIASGASLDYNLDDIYNMQENHCIIVCGSSFKTLINAGILPDYVVTVDSGPTNKWHFYSKQKSKFSNIDQNISNMINVNLIYNISVDPSIPIYFNKFPVATNAFTMTKELARMYEIPVFELGMSVSVSTVQIANYLGFDSALLYGYDFGYYKGKTQTYTHRYKRKGNKTTTKGVSGIVKTDNILLTYLNNIECHLEKINMKCENRSNCAYIKHCQKVDIQKSPKQIDTIKKHKYKTNNLKELYVQLDDYLTYMIDCIKRNDLKKFNMTKFNQILYLIKECFIEENMPKPKTKEEAIKQDLGILINRQKFIKDIIAVL